MLGQIHRLSLVNPRTIRNPKRSGFLRALGWAKVDCDSAWGLRVVAASQFAELSVITEPQPEPQS